MSQSLQFGLTQTPIVDARTGLLTRPGVLFLQALWRASSEQSTEIAALREEVQSLRARVEAIKQQP